MCVLPVCTFPFILKCGRLPVGLFQKNPFAEAAACSLFFRARCFQRFQTPSARQRRGANDLQHVRQLLQELGHDPTPEEISEEMNMPVDKVREILKIAQEPVSLETPIGEEEDSHLGDFIPDEGASEPSEAASFTLLQEQLVDVLSTLTPREVEVLSLVVRELMSKEIADRLHISLPTVNTHRKNICEKLGVKSVPALTVYAVMHGYAELRQIEGKG